MVSMELTHLMGLPSDMQQRVAGRRKDSARRRQLVWEARGLIYDTHRAVGNDNVEALLRPSSLVPTLVSFFLLDLRSH